MRAIREMLVVEVAMLAIDIAIAMSQWVAGYALIVIASLRPTTLDLRSEESKKFTLHRDHVSGA